MSSVYDLVIIGAGPAGLAAAIYAGRAKLSALVVEGMTPGGQIRITSDVVNYPGIYQTSGAAISETMRRQAEGFGVAFIPEDVTKVELSGDIKKTHTSGGGVIESISVIVATGAKPRALGFEGEKEFTGRGVAYCATCDGEFFSGMDIFVIGAGFAAAEEAIFLTRFGRKVTIIAREPEFTCSKTIADKVLSNAAIDVRFNTELLSLTGDKVPKEARFIDNAADEEWVYEADGPDGTFGVFVFVGYEPISELFRGQLDMNGQGYIITDEDMKTNIEGVYAAGDIRPNRLRQLVTAVSDGAVAATSIERFVEVKKERLGITSRPPSPVGREAGAVGYDAGKASGTGRDGGNTSEAGRDGGKTADAGLDVGKTADTGRDGGKATDAGRDEPFIDSELKEQLAPVLGTFERKVQLVLVTAGDDALSGELRQFAEDFSGLSDMVSFREVSQQEDKFGIGNYPALLIVRDDGGFTGISYHGVPGGHEFNSFVLALYNTAGPGQQFDEQVLGRIDAIDTPVNIKVCVSLSCTMCPDVVTATQYIAARNPNVTAAMLTLGYFPDLRKRYSIMSVPAMIVNDEKVYFGKKNISQILDLIYEKNN